MLPALKMLTLANGESTTSKKYIYGTRSLQKAGKADNAHLGRPSPPTTDENVLKKIVLEHRGITIREVAQDVSISVASFVQKLLIDANNDIDFLKRVIISATMSYG